MTDQSRPAERVRSLEAEVERLRERVANYERYVEREIEPKLLAEVERLRKENESLREGLRFWMGAAQAAALPSQGNP